jgi:hypothetical protein
MVFKLRCIRLARTGLVHTLFVVYLDCAIDTRCYDLVAMPAGRDTRMETRKKPSGNAKEFYELLY